MPCPSTRDPGRSDTALIDYGGRTRDAMMPCGCADHSYRLMLIRDPDPYETIWLTASFAAYEGVFGRVKAAIRELKGKPHQDTFILSRASVVELRD
jgi:hypothetical protein